MTPYRPHLPCHKHDRASCSVSGNPTLHAKGCTARSVSRYTGDMLQTCSWASDGPSQTECADLQGVARYAMDRRGPIAAGAHGSVYAAPLAIKVTKGDCRWSLEDEAEATASMNHPNICKPLFLSRHGDLLAMGMPLAQLGSLSSYLR